MFRPLCTLAALSLSALASAAPVPKQDPTRDWHGDPLPDGAVARLGTVRFRGPSTREVAFSADGTRLYSAADKVVYVWDAETGRRLPDIPCEPEDTTIKGFESVATGSHVIRAGTSYPAAGREKHELFVARLKDGKQTFKLDTPARLHFASFALHPGPACVSADGTRLAFSGGDEVSVYDLTTGRLSATLGPGVGGSVELSADGGTAGVYTGAIAVWDVAGNKKRGEFTPAGWVRLYRMSPDGKRVVGHTHKRPEQVDGKPVIHPPDDFLRVWDADAGREAGQLPLGWLPLDFRFVGPDAVVAVGTKYEGNVSTAGFVARWSLKTLKKEWETEFTPPSALWSPPYGWVAVSPDGKRLAISNRGQMAAVFDATTGKRLAAGGSHDGRVRCLDFSADGKTVYTLDEREQRAWDANTGELKAAVAPPEFRSGHPHSTVTAGTAVWTLWDKTGAAEVIGWDVAATKVVWRFKPGLEAVNRTLSPDGKRVILVGGVANAPTKTVAVYNGPTGKRTHEWNLPAAGWRDVPMAVAVDGSRLWVASQKMNQVNGRPADAIGVLLGFRVNDGEERSEVESPVETHSASDVWIRRALAPSPDGKVIATLDGSRRMAVTSLTGEPRTRELRSDGPGLSAAYFSPDGKRVVALSAHNPKAWVFDLTKADGQDPRVLDGGVSGATTAAFSPDGKRLAVGYADGSALVWDVSK